MSTQFVLQPNMQMAMNYKNNKNGRRSSRFLFVMVCIPMCFFFHNNAIMNVFVFTNFHFHQQLVMQNVPGSQIAKRISKLPTAEFL